MSFDFVAYLCTLDPSQPYSIQPLSGGLINLTVRAEKDRNDASRSSIFPGRHSVVLKYAPPFIAALGEGVPFSTSRQVSYFESEVHLLHLGFRTPE